FVVTQFAGEFSEVLRRQHQPVGPAPILVWAPDSHIEYQPMQPTRPDVRISKLMQLPGTGDRQGSGNELIMPFIRRKAHLPRLQQTDFNPLVAMLIQAPVL